MFGRVLDRLAEVHRTRHEVLVFTASGTGSMEGAVANTCSPGDRVLVVSFGNFGERWVAIAEAYGCEVVHLRYDWGETPQASDIASALAEGGATAVFTTQSETSTGVVADIEAISRAVGGAALLVVDAISSLGAVPLETDAWGVDVVVAGSQKALMTPPGPRDRSRVPGGVGRCAALEVAALLPGLGAGAEGAVRGSPGHAVHAGDHARERASTRRSACCSTRDWRTSTTAMCGSAAPPARA